MILHLIKLNLKLLRMCRNPVKVIKSFYIQTHHLHSVNSRSLGSGLHHQLKVVFWEGAMETQWHANLTT